jgi:hypothetical protein
MKKKKCILRKIKEYETELIFRDNEQLFKNNEPMVRTDFSTLIREYEEIVLPPIEIKSRWKVKGGSFELLREIDSDIKRQGIPYDSITFRDLRDFLKRRCKRPDIAELLYHEDGRIKTKMPYRAMFIE